MTSTSSEPVVLRDLPVGAVGTADTDARPARRRLDPLRRQPGARRRAPPRRPCAASRSASHHAARAQGYAAGWAEGQRASPGPQHRRPRRAGRCSVAERQPPGGGPAGGGRVRAGRRRRPLRGDHPRAARRARRPCGRPGPARSPRRCSGVRSSSPPTRPPTPCAARSCRSPLDVPPRGAAAPRRPRRARPRPCSTAAPPPSSPTPALARGDAVVETEDGSIDADVAGALARVREVLGR